MMTQKTWKTSEYDQPNDPSKSVKLFDDIFAEIGWIPLDVSKQPKKKIFDQKFWYYSKEKMEKFINQWEAWRLFLIDERKRNAKN